VTEVTPGASAQFPWLVIPARGGSRGVPRKNLRMLLGNPLISYSIRTALDATIAERVVVITDDDEIEEVARHFGAQVIREGAAASGGSTLDELMLRHLPDLYARGADPEDVLLVCQPTCPLLKPERITEAMQKFAQGAGSVITVKDDRHLQWGLDAAGNPRALYEARVNRQLLPAQFRESGAIIGSRIRDLEARGTRIVEPIELVELPEDEALDIDTFADLVVAEHWLTRLSVLIRADAGPLMGMGHVYRALALAQELARHDVLLVTSSHLPLGAEFFAEHPFEHVAVSDDYDFLRIMRNRNTDLVVLDVLDTPAQLIEDIRACCDARVVSFEDFGPGAALTDLVVNDLYSNTAVDDARQLAGVQSAILAPSFESLTRQTELSERVDEVLVLFGGTDPAGLAPKALRALEAIGYQGHVTLVRGLGAQPIDIDAFQLDLDLRQNVKNMPQLMAAADLALSSAGRTLTELATIGVPTICMAQNSKELGHSHAGPEFGVEMLGLGASVADARLELAIRELIDSAERRAELRAAGLAATAGRTNRAVVREILGRIGLGFSA
jgi:CMP-N-acetylneuraminic acid synthetase/spore coat polysaccharide biosynthesis predicted glycosyltransferase SpsG